MLGCYDHSVFIFNDPRYIPYIPLNGGQFSWSLELQPVLFQSGPVHLQLVVSSPYFICYEHILWGVYLGTRVLDPIFNNKLVGVTQLGGSESQSYHITPRATSHVNQEPWPWNFKSPKESVHTPPQDTSKIM